MPADAQPRSSSGSALRTAAWVVISLLTCLALFVAAYLAFVRHMSDAFNGGPPGSPARASVAVGSDQRADLVVFYRPGASHDEINHFIDTVLHAPRTRRGEALSRGVCSFLAVTRERPGGRVDGAAVNYCADTTAVDRDAIRQAVRASPIVFRQFENAVPDEVPLD